MVNLSGYSLLGYGEMIFGYHRMNPYARALRRAVRPGCVVVDIGAGTGIFSLLACQMGAGHVHAIEPNDAIAVAREMTVSNGFADRITLYQALSTEVTLPEPADVIISDLRGVLPLFQHHIPAIADARKRFLAEGGALIPCEDILWATLIHDPKTYRSYTEPWLTNAYGLDMKVGHPLVVNTWRRVNADPKQILLPAQQWATLDYTTIEHPDVTGDLAWTIENHCRAHGLLIWFDTKLARDVGFSNAPGSPQMIYGQGFFPFQMPIEFQKGERVHIKLGATLSGEDYVWRWDTSVFSPAHPENLRVGYRQSTFFGSPVALERLHRRAAEYTPAISESGRADVFMLSLMDGRATLGDIARQVMDLFPSRFPRWEDALARAGELAEKYH